MVLGTMTCCRMEVLLREPRRRCPCPEPCWIDDIDDVDLSADQFLRWRTRMRSGRAFGYISWTQHGQGEGFDLRLRVPSLWFAEEVHCIFSSWFVDIRQTAEVWRKAGVRESQMRSGGRTFVLRSAFQAQMDK